MAIPDYQAIMLPFLKLLADKKERSLREMVDLLANNFRLSEEEKKELLPSGLQEIFLNRVGWARTYLKKAGLVESRERGFLNITERGMSVLKEKPNEINVKLLMKFPEFREFKTRKKKQTDKVDVSGMKTPEENLEAAFQQLQQDLVAEVHQKIMECSPRFFEKLVVELLVKMGYGGTRKDAGKAIGKSGDEGIDGIINEDRLGLDNVYIQAKRWEAAIGRPEIQKFVGALLGKKGKKGVFITTSTFSKEAREYADNLESKVVLIDGELLAQYMIDFNVGVSQIANYEIKKIDIDFFIED